MKGRILLIMAAMALASLTAMGQTQITDKGYFMSPDGFKCKDGNLYTADFKTLIRAHYAETTIDDPYEYQYYGYTSIIEIPSGAEVIPSNLIYSPTGGRYASSSGTEMKICRYIVIIPESVRFIATDAFMSPNVLFFSGESSVSTTMADSGITELARYNLQGIRLRSPEEGVNIVLYSDGTARKILVREQ